MRGEVAVSTWRRGVKATFLKQERRQHFDAAIGGSVHNGAAAPLLFD